MGDDWHEFFEDFPDLDPANSDLTPEELAQANAPGWEWVRVEDARAAIKRKRETETGTDGSPDPV